MSDWLRPSEAVSIVGTGLGISREQAVLAICRRASIVASQNIVAIAEAMIGESPPNVPRMPAGSNIAPIWPFFWQSEVARDPDNSLWFTGDAEFRWSSLPQDSFVMLGIRFSRSDIDRFLGMGAGDNDNHSEPPLPAPAGPADIVQLNPPGRPKGTTNYPGDAIVAAKVARLCDKEGVTVRQAIKRLISEIEPQALEDESKIRRLRPKVLNLRPDLQ